MCMFCKKLQLTYNNTMAIVVVDFGNSIMIAIVSKFYMKTKIWDWSW
jgi:hypothetical protein